MSNPADGVIRKAFGKGCTPAAIAGTDLCRWWWGLMRELMPSHPDDSPVARDRREVFHLSSI